MPGFGGRLSFGGTSFIDPSARDGTKVNTNADVVQFPEDSDADEDIPYENPQSGARSSKRKQSPSDQADGSAKRVRVSGGKPPVSKPCTANYDSDDGRIITLKQQGYSDEFVAQKLIEEGRTRYVPKTAGSRFLRLRKAIEKEADDKLDDELSDWHIGEDDQLKESFNAIEQKYQHELQKLMDRKWKEISVKLTMRLQKRKYTGKACKERFEALENGTALKPIEIDSDQDGRAEMRATRIAEAKRRRADEAEEANRAVIEKEELAREKEHAKDEKHRNREEAKQAREAKKAANARIKAEKKAGRESKKATKESNRAFEQKKVDHKRKERMLMDIAYRQRTGKSLRRRSGGNTKKDNVVDHDENDADMSDVYSDDDTDEGSNTEDDNDDDFFRDDNNTPSKPPKKSPKATKAAVTLLTLVNPRSILTDGEIDVLLFERGLARRADDETHPQVIARLAAADNNLSGSDLHGLLGEYFDKGKGNRENKIRRLQQYDATNSAAGAKGIKSTDLAFKKGYEGYTGQYGGLLDD